MSTMPMVEPESGSSNSSSEESKTDNITSVDASSGHKHTDGSYSLNQSYSYSSSSSSSSSSPPVHSSLRQIFLYLFAHASTLGIIAIAVPTLLLRIYSDVSSSAAYTYSLISVTTAGIGFFVFPVLAMMSDCYGRKPFLILTLLGSCSAFLLIGIFDSLWSLILAAVVRGLTDVSYTMSWSVLGDVTPKPEFIRVYGLLQACAGLGIVFGPMLALGCEQIMHYRLAFLLAAGIEMANMVGIGGTVLLGQRLVKGIEELKQSGSAAAASSAGISHTAFSTLPPSLFGIAASFSDAVYVQSILDAVRRSSDARGAWIDCRGAYDRTEEEQRRSLEM